MKNLKILLFASGLFLNWTVYSQPLQAQDTTEYWTAPVWKVRELMNIALRAQAGDSLINQQEQEINRSIKYEAAQDSLIAIKDKSISVLTQTNQAQGERLENKDALIKVEKRRKRKWIFISAGLGVILVLTNLSGQ